MKAYCATSGNKEYFKFAKKCVKSEKRFSIDIEIFDSVAIEILDSVVLNNNS